MTFLPEYFHSVPEDLLDQLQTFYFLCQAETDCSKNILGGPDIDLNETGREQARAAHSKLVRHPIEHVVVSPFKCAETTARLATDGLDWRIKTFKTDANLRRRNFGHFEGKSVPDWMLTDNYSGCEPRETFGQRMVEALTHCCTEGTLIVADYLALTAILALLNINVQNVGDPGAAQLWLFAKSEGGWGVAINPNNPVNKMITSIEALSLYAADGLPTVEVTVRAKDGTEGRGSGRNEAVVVSSSSQDMWRVVQQAIPTIKDVICPAVIEMNVFAQREIDQIMIDRDGTSDKSELGRGAIYSISSAVFCAAAASFRMPLYKYIANGAVRTVPVPCVTVVNGITSGGLIKEYMILPYGAPNFRTATQWVFDVFSELQDVLKEYTGHQQILGTSRSYDAPSEDPKIVLDLIQKAIDRLAYVDRIAFALDCAGGWNYDKLTEFQVLNNDQAYATKLINELEILTQKYNVAFIVDPFHANDFAAHAAAAYALSRTIIVGDMLTANIDRLASAQQNRAIDGMVFKPHQLGTITEALEAHRVAKKRGVAIIALVRSGSVNNEVALALSVGLKVALCMIGAPGSPECLKNVDFLKRVIAENPGCGLHDIDPLLRFRDLVGNEDENPEIEDQAH